MNRIISLYEKHRIQLLKCHAHPETPTHTTTHNVKGLHMLSSTSFSDITNIWPAGSFM